MATFSRTLEWSFAHNTGYLGIDRHPDPILQADILSLMRR